MSIVEWGKKILQKYFIAQSDWIAFRQSSKSLRCSAKILSIALNDETFLAPMEDELKQYFIDLKTMNNNCSSNVKLLYGYAIEIGLKAVQLKISGRMDKSHACAKIAQSIAQSEDIVSWSEKELLILEIVEIYVNWAGRYPVPKKIEELEVFKDKRSKLLSFNTDFSIDNLEETWSKIWDVLNSNKASDIWYKRYSLELNQRNEK